MNNINEQRLEEWRTQFYEVYQTNEELENSDWKDLATGFFIALGASLDEANELCMEAVNRHTL